MRSWRTCTHDKLIGKRWVQTWKAWGSDSRFERCWQCGMDRHNAGTVKTIEQPVARPFSAAEQFYNVLHDNTKEQDNTMATTNPGKITSPDSVLDMNDEDVQPSPQFTPGASWVNVNSILYQTIVVTDAFLATKPNENRGKDVTKAYVTFYYADDKSRAPMQFSSGWAALRKQVEVLQLLNAQHKNPFPVTCGVIEMLDREPFTAPDGRAFFPLRFVNPGRLEAAEDAAINSARQLEEQVAEPVSTSPELPPADRDYRGHAGWPRSGRHG